MLSLTKKHTKITDNLSVLKNTKAVLSIKCSAYVRGLMMNKYKNKKTATSDGIIHDSKKEALRWFTLKHLEKEGEISNLRRQVPFELIPTQYETFKRFGKGGKRLADGKRCIERSVVYIADFTYTDNKDGEYIVEDCKGKRTKDYIIKRKLMLQKYGVRIKET